MCKPGTITVEIKTKFNFEEQSVGRTVKYLEGWGGLSCLAASQLGDPSFWDINCDILQDTADLEDGVHRLTRKEFLQEGNSDWRWCVNE